MAERKRSEEELRLRAALKNQVEAADRANGHMGREVRDNWDLLCEVQRFIRDQFVRLEQENKLSSETSATAKLSNRLSFLMHELSRSRSYADMLKSDLDSTSAELRAEIARQKE